MKLTQTIFIAGLLIFIISFAISFGIVNLFLWVFGFTLSFWKTIGASFLLMIFINLIKK